VASGNALGAAVFIRSGGRYVGSGLDWSSVAVKYAPRAEDSGHRINADVCVRNM